MKSAFAMLLEEAQAILHREARGYVPIHWVWDGTERDGSWQVWHDGPKLAAMSLNRAVSQRQVWTGSAGEQAVRRMVEALRADPQK